VRSDFRGEIEIRIGNAIRGDGDASAGDLHLRCLGHVVILISQRSMLIGVPQLVPTIEKVFNSNPPAMPIS
jgi:hypothetical protein